MPSYDWRQYEGRSWTQRFPDWSRGSQMWRVQSNVERATVDLFEERLRASARPTRPRVFVSHRQVDVGPAVSIAYLACQEGFDYWLDVLDPGLGGLPGSLRAQSPTPQQSAAAIAAVIEMALLNSTHVVAVMTPNTKGSQWVPYEYGRVKEPAPLTLQAACWVAGSLTASALPEYLYLGVITRTESELRSWLQSEHRNYGGAAGPCGWTAPVPSPL